MPILRKCGGNITDKTLKEEQMLYRRFARYYDYVYAWKNYENEIGVIKQLIYKYKKTGGNNLLEVGCGTGNYLKYLYKDFLCTGLDISPEMLRIAKKKVRGVRFVLDDMTNMKLEGKFDIILSLWGVISYAKTYANLEKTIQNFSKHLEVGGILIADPWYVTLDNKNKTQPYYKEGMPYMTTYNSVDLKICRMRIPKRSHNRQVMDIHTLVGNRGWSEVKYFIDRYEVGLFNIDRVIQIMKHEGIKAWFKRDTIGNGTYVGVKVS
ncbi:N,N-dimethyltransferase [mine drainage metagenome]|uniref:N,N-dimethyltransferase n=1 Tax=mine drainage metagenome TaxID=410659 RepID=T1A4Q6_9ZZZZ